MTAAQFSLAATILLLFPMLYFLVASLTFFLAKLKDPVVTRMLRGLFNTYFGAVGGLGLVAALAFAVAGLWQVSAVLALVAALALAARVWFVQGLDAAVRARDAGEEGAIGRLRQLHVTAIGYNLVQLACLVSTIPRLLTIA